MKQTTRTGGEQKQHPARRQALLLLPLALGALSLPPIARGQAAPFTFPGVLTAGSPISIPTSGSGKATLFVVGPGQALRRDVQMGEPIAIAAGDLHSAGHYIATLASASSGTGVAEFDLVPSTKPGTLGFLAKPSRLSVGLHNGISGSVYVFDPYGNLITAPLPVSLELSTGSAAVRARVVTTRNGLAWAEMDSAAKEGAARFIARVGDVRSTRIIDQVPGDPCSLSISAHLDGSKLEVQTAPVHDCTGNAIPDGTIVTFTQTVNGTQSTVDVPIKQGVARVHLPASSGARIAAASGVVAGNEIRWEGGR